MHSDYALIRLSVKTYFYQSVYRIFNWLKFSCIFSTAAPVVTDVCLGCICEAVSGCDRTLKCSDGICGLFGITWAYWADSGKPTLNGRGDAKSEDGSYSILSEKCVMQTLEPNANWFFSFPQLCKWSILRCRIHPKIHEQIWTSKQMQPNKWCSAISFCLIYLSISIRIAMETEPSTVWIMPQFILKEVTDAKGICLSSSQIHWISVWLPLPVAAYRRSRWHQNQIKLLLFIHLVIKFNSLHTYTIHTPSIP